MKMVIGSEADVCMRLKFEAVMGVRRLKFLLLEFHLFTGTEDGSALSLNLPTFLFPWSLILYMIETRALLLLKLPCYFVKMETKTVGLWAIQEQPQSLVVASLGVKKDYRRLGIGTCVLSLIEKIAKQRGKKWLEVDVSTKNAPAKRFYAEFGFTFVPIKKMLFVTRGKKPL